MRRVVFVITCVTALVATSIGVAAASDQERPFRGYFVSTEMPPVEPPPGCEMFFGTTQVGNFTHLGMFMGIGETCGFNLRVVEDPPFDIPGGEPPYFVADFTVEQTWTAANGDHLFVSTPNGVFVQSLSDGTSGARGTLVVLGGTGRFEGASGEAEGVGAGARLEFDGRITFDAGG